MSRSFSQVARPSPLTRTEDFPYRVQVLDCALGILDTLADEGPELSLGELCARLGLHKSTVHRLLMVLEQHRFVARHPQNDGYRLGLKLFELGSKAVAQLDPRAQAESCLERLVRETGETAHLCILDESEVVYLEKVEAPRAFRIPSSIAGPASRLLEEKIPLLATAVMRATNKLSAELGYRPTPHTVRRQTFSSATTPQ